MEIVSISFTVEGLKLVEVEKCKKDINEIKNQMYDAQRKLVDYTRLRWDHHSDIPRQINDHFSWLVNIAYL